jgi:DUF438 domain-containing protein
MKHLPNRSVLSLTENTSKEKRLQILKSLILELHAGGDLNKLRNKFKQLLVDVDASEIAEMEQSLINKGDLTPKQITKLCDLHVGIFEDSLKEKEKVESIPGHPLHTYLEENMAARKLIHKIRKSPSINLLDELSEIEKHYTRLENQLFPKLEKVGFTGPSQVMWAKHDEIRAIIKKRSLEAFEELLKAVEDMIFKEEKILFPTSLKKLSKKDWIDVKHGEEEIGFAWITPGDDWKPVMVELIHSKQQVAESQKVKLSTGNLNFDQIDLLLKNLPVDITFVNETDEIIYYSDTTHRIFPRSPGIIGRTVQRCHPPKSLHIVESILQAFKIGDRDIAEFWIRLEGKVYHIRYFALRDDAGKYQGTIEVSQDITKIQKLTGENRLLDWK